MEWTVRRLAPEDRELFLAMSREFYASPAVLHPVRDEYHSRAFQELQRSDAYLEGLLLEAGGAAAGYGLLSKTYSREAGGRAVWVEELYLRPAFRGRGGGSAFFRWLAVNVPAARYRLETEPDNAGARALYRRLGFRELPYLQMVRDVTPMSEEETE